LTVWGKDEKRRGGPKRYGRKKGHVWLIAGAEEPNGGRGAKTAEGKQEGTIQLPIMVYRRKGRKSAKTL